MTRTEAIEQSRGPLAMTEENYRKVVGGQKTQTRRILDIGIEFDAGDFYGPEWFAPVKVDRHGEEYPGKEIFGIWSHHEWGAKAKFAPGDITYIPEPVQILVISGNANGAMCDIEYLWERFDVPSVLRDVYLSPDEMRKVYARKRGWNVPTTARFMRKAFAREFVRITGVRVERLQDIDEAEALAEGIGEFGEWSGNEDVTTPVGGFRELWQSIHGAESWAANPWCWVYEFERLEVIRASYE